MSIYQLEHDGDVQELTRLVVGSESSAVRARAASALGEVTTEGDVTEGDAVVELLTQVATEDAEAEVRAAAIDALDGIGAAALRGLFGRLDEAELDPDAPLPVDVLVDALGSDTPELRMAAANVIGHDGVTEAVPELLARLDDPNPRVKRRVVRAAGNVGDRRAVDPLSTLVDHDAPRLRRDVATALGDIGGEHALEAVGPLLRDPEVSVRCDAVLALGQFDRCRPVGRLVERLADDAEAIRRAAAYGVVDLLSNAPAQESHDLRTEVVETLSTAHDEAVVAALVELFEESTEARRRRNAAWLLGRVSDREDVAVGTLVAALDDDDETVRRFAATSLVAIGGEAVETTLLDALPTTFGEGRKMILFVLGKVGTERARTALTSLLDEVDDLEVQERVLAALSRLGGREGG